LANRLLGSVVPICSGGGWKKWLGVEELVVVGGEFGYAAEEVEDSWHQVAIACGQAKFLASALASEGYPRCTVVLQASLALC
jgi:hypothetical protein